jgi:hypothetical protein
MYFIICFIILGIGLSLLGWGIFIGDGDLGEILGVWGISISFLISIFGFGLTPAIFTGYEEIHYSKGFNYVKSPTAVYVEFIKQPSGQRETMSLNDINTYNNIDEMKLQITTSYNFYGGCTGNQFKLVKK